MGKTAQWPRKRIYTGAVLRNRLSALVIALIVAGSPVAAMVCQFTCVADAAADPHACCHHAGDSTGQALTCATADCDRAAAVTVAPAVAVERLVVGPDTSIPNIQLPAAKATAFKKLSWAWEVGDWKLAGTPARTTQLRI